MTRFVLLQFIRPSPFATDVVHLHNKRQQSVEKHHIHIFRCNKFQILLFCANNMMDCGENAALSHWITVVVVERWYTSLRSQNKRHLAKYVVYPHVADMRNCLRKSIIICINVRNIVEGGVMNIHRGENRFEVFQWKKEENIKDLWPAWDGKFQFGGPTFLPRWCQCIPAKYAKV